MHVLRLERYANNLQEVKEIIFCTFIYLRIAVWTPLNVEHWSLHNPHEQLIHTDNSRISNLIPWRHWQKPKKTVNLAQVFPQVKGSVQRDIRGVGKLAVLRYKYGTLAIELSEPVFVNLLKSPGIDYQPGGPQQPYLTYRPARQHRLAESIPRNRFLERLQIRVLFIFNFAFGGWHISVSA